MLVLCLGHFCLENVMSIFKECFLKQLQLRMTGRRRDRDRDRRHLSISPSPRFPLRSSVFAKLRSCVRRARRDEGRSAETVKSGPAVRHGITDPISPSLPLPASSLRARRTQERSLANTEERSDVQRSRISWTTHMNLGDYPCPLLFRPFCRLKFCDHFQPHSSSKWSVRRAKQSRTKLSWVDRLVSL